MDQNFHDVTIVDMDEEREPKVTFANLTHLRDAWPPGIFNHMQRFQQDLMRNGVIVPGVIVYRVERHPTRLYGTFVE